MRENPKGRRKKAKARLNNYERLLAEERNVKLDSVQIHIPPGPRLGDKVIEAADLRKGFGDRLLIEDLSFSLPPAGIVGVIGANGAGKTTLFQMIVGQEQPDGGRAHARRHRRARLRRPVARRARPRQDRLGGDLRRLRQHQGRRARDRLARLRRRLQLQGLRPAAQGRRALRRRAQPRAPGQAAAPRRQHAAARRADQRPRRRHAARARGGAARVPGLRRGDLARSLVPRPRRDARARVRGRLAGASGSRATSRPTRSTATSGSAPRPTARTGSPTRSSSAA